MNRWRKRRAAFRVVVTAACLSAFAAAEVEAKHPRLVSASAARCSTCHSELLEDRAIVHPATEDCTNCHDVAIDRETGTTITLLETEPTLCVACHSEQEDLDALATPHYPATEGCTTCHDPHATDRPRLLSARQAEVCAECHDLEDLGPIHGGQISLGTTCTTCHDPHGTETPRLFVGSNLHAPFEDQTCDACHRPRFGERIRLQARGQRLCLACHEDPADIAGRMSTHAALIDEDPRRAACLSCHNPHLSNQSRMLVESGTRLCAQCHEPVVRAANATTGHAAASDDCGNCHLPHAAESPRLLTAFGTELCLECHDGEDEDLQARHLGANLNHLSCLTCHSPHGAGQPSLLNENVHPPVLDDCSLCHSGGFDELEEDGESALCLMCHDDIEEAATSAPVPHEAMEAGSCTVCHSPHATPRPKFVKEAADGCGSCHSDKIPEEGEFGHGVNDLLGCQACHEPHGGSRPQMLRAEGAELCLACHGGSARAGKEGQPFEVFGNFEILPEELAEITLVRLSADGQQEHPVEGHRTLGTPTAEELAVVDVTFTGELTCTVCHDPHKGQAPALLRWGATSPSEACLECHPK